MGLRLCWVYIDLPSRVAVGTCGCSCVPAECVPRKVLQSVLSYALDMVAMCELTVSKLDPRQAKYVRRFSLIQIVGVLT